MSRIILQPNLGWEVVETKVNFHTENISTDTEYKGLVRSDNGFPLGIHSKSYSTMFNSELTDYCNQIADTIGGSVVGYSEYQKGKTLLGIVKSPDSLKSVNELPIQDYIIIGNSHTNKGSFFGTSTFIPRCSNQFGKIMKNATVRHTSNGLNRRREIVKLYDIYKIQLDELYETFVKMKEIPVDAVLKDSLIKRLFDVQYNEEISVKKQNIIDKFNESYRKETSELGENVWGLFNAGTHYSTHILNEKSKNVAYGNIIGSGASFNEKLYSEIEKVLIY